MSARLADELRGDLERWVKAGLLTGDQAAAIVAHEARPAAPDGGVSVLAEALGYAGAAPAIAAIPPALALAAGSMLRSKTEPAFRRLMSLLWFLSIGGFAGTAGIIIAEYATDFDEDWVPLVIGLAMLFPAFVLWRLLPAVLQQLALLGGLVVTVMGLFAVVPGEPNGTAMALAAWGIGVAWVVLGWRGWPKPQMATMVVGSVVAAYMPVIAAQDHEWLLALGIATGAALMVLSVRSGALPLLAIGTVTVFAYVTGVVLRYFRDQLGVPLALMIIGAVFIVLAFRAARLGKFRRAAE